MKIPGKSVIVGWAVASAASVGVAYLNAHGIQIPDALTVWLVGTLTAAVIHYVPDSVQSIIDQLNNSIVIKAIKDPNSAVTLPLMPPPTPPVP